MSYLSVDDARGQPEAGAQERLSKTGDNLANVVQYLKEQHPQHLERVFETLRRRIPRLEKVLSEPMQDGRLLLRIKDAPFSEPVLARFASDGTLKMLAYLVVLLDPNPSSFIGIEEPENFLHPRLLHVLAEECRAATERSRLLVTTHSPFFLNGLRAKEVRVLYRDDHGYIETVRAADVPGIPKFSRRGCRPGRSVARGSPRRGRSARQLRCPGAVAFGEAAMTVDRVELLVEDVSTEAALELLCPRSKPRAPSPRTWTRRETGRAASGPCVTRLQEMIA